MKALESLPLRKLRHIRGKQTIKMTAEDAKRYSLVLDGNEKLSSLGLVKMAGMLLNLLLTC